MKLLELTQLLNLSKNLRDEIREKMETKTKQLETVFDPSIELLERRRIIDMKMELDTINQFIKLLCKSKGE